MKPTQRVIAATLDLRTFTVPLLVATSGAKANTVRSVLSRHRQYFTKTSAPTGGRGGQLQKWTVMPERRDQLIELMQGRGTAEPVLQSERLTLSEGGELSSSLGQRTRTPEAFRELATEDELDQYDVYAASRLLPELVVRLVLTIPSLIDLFDGSYVAGAKTIGLTVIVPMGIGDDQNRATLVLPRLDVIAATDCLSTSGVPYDLASTIAQAIDRSLPSFRRTNSVNPTHKRPQWANERSDLVAPLSLLGSWNSDSVDDQEVVSRMTRRNYTDVERDLQRLAAYEDSPFIASGNNWQLVSSEDAFALVGGTLTKGILEVWFAAALDVLHEPNPLDELRPDESLHATIKGVGRRHSTSLRTGIARGAALLGSSGRRLHGAVSVADYARRLVRALLVDGTDDAIWRTLADVLPLLAEAAPDEFLSAISSAMQGSASEIRSMFADQGPAPLFGGDSPHVHLLWALELLAQSEEFAAEALYRLARMAEIDPGGRLVK